MAEYVEREPLLAEYDREHEGPPGRARELIVNAPAADVAPVRHGFDTNESRYFHCSVCDYGASDVYEDGPTYCYEKQKEWNYCPNCGAKMDGGET